MFIVTKTLNMKNLLFTTLVIGAMSPVFAQTSSDLFFSKYEGKDGFTSVNISEKLFDMMATAAPENEADFKELSSGIKGIKVLVFENEEGSLRSRELYKEADVAISLNGFDELMSVVDQGEKVRILSRQITDTTLEELIILVASDEEFVLVDIFGKIDLNKLSDMAGELDIEGLEKLNELDK
jgi:hypothetical protein